MRTTSFRLALTASMLIWPLTAAADAPANVAGLKAELRGAQVFVEWQGEESDTITAYNIYLSQKSILENKGTYDDYVTVGGRLRQFIITEVPPYPEIFISLTAVNGAGEESPAFIEEVRLDLAVPGGPGEVRMRETPTQAEQALRDSFLALLSAESRSPTEVALTFSRSVMVPNEVAGSAFQITDSNGQAVNLLRLELQESTVIITTAPLMPQMQYTVTASPVISGITDTGGAVSLDTTRASASFTGYGVAPEPGSPVQGWVSSPSPEPLTSSGAGAMSAFLVSGAVTGWKRFKKKRAVPNSFGTEFTAS